MSKYILTYISCIDGEWYAFSADDDSHCYPIGNDRLGFSGYPKTKRHIFEPYDPAREVKKYCTPSPNKRAAVEKAKKYGDYCGDLGPWYVDKPDPEQTRQYLDDGISF